MPDIEVSALSWCLCALPWLSEMTCWPHHHYLAPDLDRGIGYVLPTVCRTPWVPCPTGRHQVAQCPHGHLFCAYDSGNCVTVHGTEAPV
jgi:hypothetical protein